MSETEHIHLYVTETMADWEAGHAIAHIRKPSWQRRPGRYDVRTVAAASGVVTTMGGARIEPDATLEALTPKESAMLILPGADTWEQGGHTEATAKAAEFLDAGTPVAAICGATYGLALAGLLDDRDHTSNALEYLAMSGYGGAHRYRDDVRTVNDGGLITASGTQPVDFAAAIFAELDLYEPDVLDAWHGLYSTGDPAHFAVLAAA